MAEELTFPSSLMERLLPVPRNEVGNHGLLTARVFPGEHDWIMQCLIAGGGERVVIDEIPTAKLFLLSAIKK